MAFFRQSFENLGETLRTVSLVIGLLITSLTGVGYVYTMITDQKALAVEVDGVSKRVGVVEDSLSELKLQNHRLTTVETGQRDLNRKVDRVLEILAVQGTKDKR